jgi:M6 family metalloprotease-like protein
MRKVSLIALTLVLLTILPLPLQAQGDKVVRGDCLSGTSDEGGLTRGAQRRLPTPSTNWDPSKTYRQMVILMSFSDKDFSMPDPQATYDSIFNYNGYNQRNGKGCVADYFRDQSNGLFNMEFDIFGPVKVESVAQPYEKPTEKTKNYGSSQFREATTKVIAENLDWDYSQYDWNNDGYVDQIIVVYAGYGGNNGEGSYGHIWPNTGSFSSITTSNFINFSNFTASAEVWPNNASCGIGTICHEFSHSLGLPDMYDTSSGDPVVDEWDLMDGGNFTNYGWCPPNYTCLEKMLLGWLTPVELDDSITVEDLKPVEEGGEAFRIKHSNNEWLLLENRQQRGWDAGAPGKGLVIYHVDYNASAWQGNYLNGNASKRRFELINADNTDFITWENYIKTNNLGRWANKPRMNNRCLSTSPYPWSTIKADSVPFVNNELTETSVPAPVMNNSNGEGKTILNKPITNIQMTDEGLISFDFMGGTPLPDAIQTPAIGLPQSEIICDMQGRLLQEVPTKGFYIIRKKDGTVRKIFR